MFLSLFWRCLVVALIIVFVFIIQVNSQMETCELRIQNTMNEYRQCVDYSYLILFSMKYYELSTTAIAQKCTENNFAKCRTTAEKRLGGCLNFSQRESLETTFQIVDAGYKYWCSEYGLKLMDFYTEHAPDCYFRQQSLFRTCELEYPIINIYLQNYDSNYCRSQAAVMNCLQQVYERCLSHEDPTLIRGYYETMWKNTPCFVIDQQYLFNSISIKAFNVNTIIFCMIFIITQWNFFSQN